MSDSAREVEIGESGFTILVAALVGALSLAFWLGVRVGRGSAEVAVVVPGMAPGAVAHATPPATAVPAAAARPSLAPSVAVAAVPARPASSETPAARRRPARGFQGPPPRRSPAPVGGAPGISQRGERKAVALEVLVAEDMDRAMAERLRLLGQGYPAYVATVPDASGAPRYRVRVGDYATVADAEIVRRQLRESEGLAASLIN